MPKRHAILPVKDVNQQVFVRRLGHYLKKSGKVTPADWTDTVKTGYSKELPPNNPDWVYVRMAAVARRVYMRSPSGVGALSRRYGGLNKRRGVRPNHTATSSKKIIRYSLQELEKLGWVKKAVRGRKLTRKGRQFMDEFSGRVCRSKMVTEYWKRKARMEKKAKKAARQEEEPTTGDAAVENVEQDYQYVQQTAGGDVVEVEQFD